MQPHTASQMILGTKFTVPDPVEVKGSRCGAFW
jgi:hypothetical protein